MGVVQLSDELHGAIERQVAEGRAASPAAFLEAAVRRLLDDTTGEEDALRQAAVAGAADIAAGRCVTVATGADGQRVLDGMMDRLRARLSAGT